MWYIGSLAILTHVYVSGKPGCRATPVMITLTYIILALLLVIIVVADPVFRVNRQDEFEFAPGIPVGLAIALYWAPSSPCGKEFDAIRSISCKAAVPCLTDIQPLRA